MVHEVTRNPENECLQPCIILVNYFKQKKFLLGLGFEPESATLHADMLIPLKRIE